MVYWLTHHFLNYSSLFCFECNKYEFLFCFHPFSSHNEASLQIRKCRASLVWKFGILQMCIEGIVEPPEKNPRVLLATNELSRKRNCIMCLSQIIRKTQYRCMRCRKPIWAEQLSKITFFSFFVLIFYISCLFWPDSFFIYELLNLQ